MRGVDALVVVAMAPRRHDRRVRSPTGASNVEILITDLGEVIALLRELESPAKPAA